MPQTPIIGLTAVFNFAKAEAGIKRYQQRIRDLEKEHKRLADRVNELEKKKESAVSRGSGRQTNALRRLRWEMVTLMFFIRMVSRAVSEAWDLMAESAETSAARQGTRALARSYEVNLGAVARALADVSDGALSAKDAITTAQAALLQDQGEFSSQYADLWEAARVAMVTAGADSQESFEAMIESLVTGSGEAIDSVTGIFQVRLALQEYAEANNTTVDALERREAAEVILQTIYGRTQELLAAGADEALAERDSIDKVKASWQNFRDVLGVVAKPDGLLEVLNNLLTTTTQLIIILSGIMDTRLAQGLSRVISHFTPLVGLINAVKQTVELATPGLELFGGALEKSLPSSERVKEGLEALNLFNDQVDEGSYVYKRFIEQPGLKIDPIIDHILKREDIMADHARRVAEIERQRTNRMEDIQIKYEQKVDKIERRTLRSRQKAWRDYYRRRRNEVEDYELDVEHDTQRHLEKLRQMEDDYRLEALHDERMYRYERMMLVAEGDVLAIEDLDARYALEQQAKQENFQQDQQHERENFSTRMQQQREEFELELEQLRRALDDQLTEISIRREDQLEEAEIARQEDIRRANRDYEQRLADEQANHEASLLQWRQHWAKISEQTKVGADKITEIINEYFGPMGIADTIVADFSTRMATRLDIRSLVERIVGRSAITPTRGEVIRSYSPYQMNPELYRQYGRGYQTGGVGMVSSPTLVPMGEGGTPERFSVSPLGGAGASVVLSWGGGAIPVHGTGEMSGMDLGEVGNAIAQGLVVELRNQLITRRA